MIHTASPYELCRCGVVHRASRDELPPFSKRRLRPFDAMFYSNTAKNGMLQWIADHCTHVALHTAYSESGANELASPYARSVITWGTPASGLLDYTGTPPAWTVPASTGLVPWVSGWNSATIGGGTIYFMVPLGGESIQPCSVETNTDGSANDIFCKGHNLPTGKPVVFWPSSGFALPSGITKGNVYYVITSGLATNSLRVSTALNGTAVDIADTGAPWNFCLQAFNPESYSAQGTLSAGAIRLDLAALF
jgi:hypothetical protein